MDYKHYCLGFNKEHKQANWVYYELGSANLTGKRAGRMISGGPEDQSLERHA
ncbi:MAG: hypothetical protein ACLU4J_22050 [Butyricimonas paravirosa]